MDDDFSLDPDKSSPNSNSQVDPPDPSAPLLNFLFPGDQAKSVGSIVYALVGVLTYAIAISALSGAVTTWVSRNPQRINSTIEMSLLFLAFASSYPTTVLALQWFASFRAPLSLRLALVYATLYSCLRAATYGLPQHVDGTMVLVSAPICIGGFIQHRRGWSALSWGQSLKPPGKISIASLLDLTAAFAITMGIASTAPFDADGLSCLIPGSFVTAIVGLHAWGRLTALSDQRKHRDTGLAMWMVGNAIAGCIVFLFIVMSSGGSDVGLLAFVVGPLVVLFAHATTWVPISWLKVCGWTFQRWEAD